MLKCPRFKPHYPVEVVADKGVFVLSETEQTLLQEKRRYSKNRRARRN